MGILEKLIGGIIVVGCAFIGIAVTVAVVFIEIVWCKFVYKIYKLIGGSKYEERKESIETVE